MFDLSLFNDKMCAFILTKIHAIILAKSINKVELFFNLVSSRILSKCFIINDKGFTFKTKSITDKLLPQNMPLKYVIISVLMIRFVPLRVTITAQTLVIFPLETRMFLGTLADCSAANSQPCDTESNALA